MTPFSPLRRFGAPIASAIATAAVFTGALWVQHSREAWPFAVEPQAVASPTGSAMPPAAGTTSTHDRVPVDVTGATVQELDIRLEVVRRESLMQSVRAVATIVPDESRISHVHTRVAGWVEQLDVNTTGETVTAGQPLARIFSQELLSSQTEYLAARKNTAASGITSAVVASGRTRLTVLGMTPAEIDAIIATHPFTPVYCMPLGGDKAHIEANCEAVIELCKRRGFIYSDRLHIRIWDQNHGV